MNEPVIIATSRVTETDLKSAKLGPRAGRMDLASQLALLAVEKLSVDFEKFPRDRVAIILAARAGSLTTDIEFWKGRDAVGGPSPTLFAYTLPSAAIGEIAIRHRITGPNLCFTGGGEIILPEAKDLLRRGDVDACVCVALEVISNDASKLTELPPSATAQAWLIQFGKK